MNAHIDKIRREIMERSLMLCCDNLQLAHLQHEIETAMLIGASIVMEIPIDPTDETEGGLSVTPEGEELLRQLFEGDANPFTNRTPAGIGKTYIDGKVTLG